MAPGQGHVLVTGAGGGVGGFAVALLAKQGFEVAAVTGRANEAARLHELGADEVLSRDQFSQPGKPLAEERGLESVGSYTLVNACAGSRYGCIVAACGLAQGMVASAAGSLLTLVEPKALMFATLISGDGTHSVQDGKSAYSERPAGRRAGGLEAPHCYRAMS